MSTQISQTAAFSLAHESATPGEGTANIPRPQHFITRGDGSITPLIAVDELPDSVRIVGVPAAISQAMTFNMVNLGVQARSQTKYIVEMPEDSGSGNTGNVSQPSTTTGSSFQLQEKQSESQRPIRVEENTAAGVTEVEQWRLGVKTVEETQVPRSFHGKFPAVPTFNQSVDAL